MTPRPLDSPGYMVGVARWQNSLARDVSFLAYRDIFTTVYKKKYRLGPVLFWCVVIWLWLFS